MKTGVLEIIRSIDDGGAETLVKDYALLVNKEKFDVYVLGQYQIDHAANTKILRESGTPLSFVYPGHGFFCKAFNAVFGKWYFSHTIKKMVKAHHIKTIHAHMTVLRYLVPISDYLQKNGVRILYTCHHMPERYFGGRQAAEGEAAKFLIEHNGLRLIGLHEEMVQELNERFSVNNSVFIRNGIDFRKYRDIQETKQVIRRALGVPENAFVLGHVGRFYYLKNHKFLVEVFRLLAQRRGDAFLLMVGAGDEMAGIKAKLEEYGLQGKFMILSNRPDVHRILKAMDVFVFPSLAEGLGIALVEAQVSGLRSVVSDTIPEEAFLTPLVVPLSLEDPIEKWCDAIEDDQLFGSYQGDINKYDMNQEIKRLENLYMGIEG